MSVCAAGPVTLHSPPICPCQSDLLSSPLLSSFFYSLTFFSLFTLTFGKLLLSHSQHEHWAAGVHGNQAGSWLILIHRRLVPKLLMCTLVTGDKNRGEQLVWSGRNNQQRVMDVRGKQQLESQSAL